MTDSNINVSGFNVVEIIEPHELVKALVGCGGDALANVEAKCLSATEPQRCEVRGVVSIYGDYHVWEIEVDLRNLRTAEAIMDLAANINTCIGKAALQVGRPG